MDDSSKNAGAHDASQSWLGRLWHNFLLFGAAMEMTEAELLERRVAALEAANKNNT